MSRSPENPRNADVFISYAQDEDGARAIELADSLEKAGATVWIAERSIEGAQNYGPEIVAAIRGCKVVVLLCSQASLQSEHVAIEIELAFEAQRPRLPLLLEQTPIPDRIAYWLTGANRIDISGPVEQWLPRVLRALQRLGVDCDDNVSLVPHDVADPGEGLGGEGPAGTSRDHVKRWKAETQRRFASPRQRRRLAGISIAIIAIVGIAVAGLSVISGGGASAAAGVITTVAGDGQAGSTGGPGVATRTGLDPAGLAIDARDTLYISDTGTARVWKVSSGGAIGALAGTGLRGSLGDGGAAIDAQLGQPTALAVDAQGNVFIADTSNDNVRKVSEPAGTITTAVGNGTPGSGGDRLPATLAQLNGPSALAIDAHGNLYIADTGNNRVREVSHGVITTVAGNGEPGSIGDGGPATKARLNAPEGLALDARGDLFILESGAVREVSHQTITTVARIDSGTSIAGNGTSTASSNLSNPGGLLAADADGNLFIADTINNRLQEISPAGTVTTIAGAGGHAGFYGDGGPATKARLAAPAAVTVDHRGDIYVADGGNLRVRKIARSKSNNTPIASTTTTTRGTSQGTAGGALLIAQQLATDLANHDWASARSIAPTLASDDQLAAGYSSLVTSTIVEIDNNEVSPGSYYFDLAFIAHERIGETEQTSIYCGSWTVDTIAHTVSLGNGALRRPDQGPLPGFVDPDLKLQATAKAKCQVH